MFIIYTIYIQYICNIYDKLFSSAFDLFTYSLLTQIYVYAINVFCISFYCFSQALLPVMAKTSRIEGCNPKVRRLSAK